MVEHLNVELASFVAGAAITASTLPKIAERIHGLLRRTSTFNLADCCRDGLQAFGNAAWIYVGYRSDLVALQVFCGLNLLLLLTLLVLNLRGRVPLQPAPDGTASE